MKILISLLFLCAAATSYWWPDGEKRNQEPSKPQTNTRHSPNRSGNRFAEDIEFQLRSIRDARNPREQALAVAELATRLPVDEGEDWINKGYLRFLDHDLEQLFRSIITQRWLEEDPATLTHSLVERRWHSGFLTRYFEAWVKADREAAVAYVRSQQPRMKSIPSAVALAVAVAQTDVPAALALLDEFRTGWSAQLSLKGPLTLIARQDHEAVLRWIDRLSPNARKTGIAAVATAALETDFAWSIALLQREGLGWEGLKDARPNTPSLFLTNLDMLPPEWITPLAPTLAYGNELAWLELREHPSLTSAQLKLIHEHAADRFYDLEGDRGLALIRDGTWLPEDVHQSLATLALSSWHADPAFAQEWIDTLDESLRPHLQEELAEMISNGASNQKDERLSDPHQTIQLLSDVSSSFDIEYQDWSQSEIAQVLSQARSLPPATAAAIVDRVGATMPGPPEVAAAIVERAIAPGSPLQLNPHGDHASLVMSLGDQWGKSDPAAAAAWMETLPPGPWRVAGLQAVARQWRKLSPSELESWADSLGESDQQSIRDALSNRN